MRKTSLLRHVTLLCSVVVFFSCKNSKVAVPSDPPSPELEFSLEATARPYMAAMGKGRGVLFHLFFTRPDSMHVRAFELDSLVIHGKLIPATWKEEANKPVVEGNYFVPVPDPEPGVIPMPTTESPDPILYLSEYLPARLYFHYEGKAYSEAIDHFHTISE
jgi:hypothetical protein